MTKLQKDPIRYADIPPFDGVILDDFAQDLCRKANMSNCTVEAYFHDILCIADPGSDFKDLVKEYRGVVDDHHSLTITLKVVHCRKEE